MPVGDILDAVRGFGCRLVLLTGGEPLLQAESGPLVRALLDRDYTVLIETSGAVPIKGIDRRAVIILDIKCPGSGMSAAMDWENLKRLKQGDEVKFVIADRADFEWSREVLAAHRELREKIIHFSPVFGELPPERLAGWILEARLPVRLQLQLHKYIWDPSMRGV